jgi:beta-N-acetylhexosaminidase
MITGDRSAVIFGCKGPVLLPREAGFFRDVDPSGFILFARNVVDPDQLRRLTGDLRAAVGWNAPVLVDQEGGRVQRLRSPHWREFLPALDQTARAGDRAERAAYLRGLLLADDLARVGIDANCAPCADIASAQTHPFLQNRCFGFDPTTVARMSRALANGHLAGGVMPVMKHLPGHGRAVQDTHHDLGRVTVPLEELESWDFAPFRALNDLPMAMTAHIVFDAIDPDHPATQSPKMIAAIRDRIGFGGFLMSDDLNMQALSGDLAERTTASLAAGCDAVLHCKGDWDEMHLVASALRPLTAEAGLRLQQALDRRGAAKTIDIAAAEAELSAILAGKVDV